MTDAARLWFPLVAPALAFGAEGAFGWWIGARICEHMSIASGRVVVAVVTLAMLAISAGALATALGSYRRANPGGVAADRVQFMALGGVLVSTAFLVGLVWFGLNAAFVHQCGGAR